MDDYLSIHNKSLDIIVKIVFLYILTLIAPTVILSLPPWIKNIPLYQYLVEFAAFIGVWLRLLTFSVRAIKRLKNQIFDKRRHIKSFLYLRLPLRGAGSDIKRVHYQTSIRMLRGVKKRVKRTSQHDH